MTTSAAIGYERIVDSEIRPLSGPPAPDPRSTAAATPGDKKVQLAAELRRTRLAAHLSRSELAQDVGLPESDLSRFETGQVIPSVGEVARWGHAVGAPDNVKKQLLSLAAAVSEVAVIPYLLPTDVVALQDELSRLEASSPSQLTCVVGLVPGLLQTPDYAQMIMAFNALPRADQDAAVDARIRRQAIIHDPTKRFEFIISESALKWSMPGAARTVLRNQLRQLTELAALPNVSIGVIRANARTKVPMMQSYYIFEDASIEGWPPRIDLVQLETPSASIIISDALAVRSYRRDLSWLREAAEFGPDAVGMTRRKKAQANAADYK